MKIKDILSNFFSSISINLGNKPDSVKELEFKQKHIDKRNKAYQKMQYRRFFAECSLSELRTIERIIKNNNNFIKIRHDKFDEDRQFYYKGIKENLYQIDDEFEEMYDYNENEMMKIRINVLLYKKIVREFNKNGQQRIPQKNKGGKKR